MPNPIKTHIDTNNLTKAEAARQLGVSPVAVGRWYKGRIPARDALFLIHNVWGIPFDAFDQHSPFRSEQPA